MEVIVARAEWRDNRTLVVTLEPNKGDTPYNSGQFINDGTIRMMQALNGRLTLVFRVDPEIATVDHFKTASNALMLLWNDGNDSCLGVMPTPECVVQYSPSPATPTPSADYRGYF
jgi:hypothetical protein